MTDVELFTVTWADKTGKVSVEMYATDRVAWQRCCALMAAGVDAQIDKRGIEILR